MFPLFSLYLPHHIGLLRGLRLGLGLEEREPKSLLIPIKVQPLGLSLAWTKLIFHIMQPAHSSRALEERSLEILTQQLCRGPWNPSVSQVCHVNLLSGVFGEN